MAARGQFICNYLVRLVNTEQRSIKSAGGQQEELMWYGTLSEQEAGLDAADHEQAVR